MITRNLHAPTHGAGMPTSVPNAHGQLVYGPHMVATPPDVANIATTMALPPESIMYDPSNPASDPYEQHYPSGAASGTPVATRYPYFLMNNPQPAGNGAGGDKSVGTRPVR